MLEHLDKTFDKLVRDKAEEFAKETEAHNHRLETAARGKQQSQYANYRKISQMASDMQTLLGISGHRKISII